MLLQLTNAVVLLRLQQELCLKEMLFLFLNVVASIFYISKFKDFFFNVIKNKI